MTDPFRSELASIARDLKGMSRQKLLRDQLREQIARGLDPEQAHRKGEAEYKQYADDPVGFAYDVLRVEYLTPDQEEFMRAVADYSKVIALSATGTGKTFALSILTLWFFFARYKPQVWMFAAPPEDNLKLLLWGEIRARIEEVPALFEEVDVRASMYIERAAKEFVQGVSIPRSATDEDIVSSFSGKHAPSIMFIGDEADAIPDAVFEGVDGCLSGGFPRLVLCLNPKKKSGYCHTQLERGLAKPISMSAFSHPNVVSGEDVVPGAVTREKTVERINEWAEPLPLVEEEDEWCFRLPEFLEGTTAKAGSGVSYPPLQPGLYRVVDPQFFTKVLGLYPPAGANQLIHPNWIDGAVSKWEALRQANGGSVVPPEGIAPVMSLDVAGDGADDNAIIWRYGDWYDLPEVWHGVDADMTAETAARRYVERGASRALVDAAGVGAGVAPKMSRLPFNRDFVEKMRAAGHEVGSINAVAVQVGEKSNRYNEAGRFFTMRDEGYWMLRLAFQRGNIMIPPADRNQACKRLHDALKKMTYQEDGKVIKVVKKKDLKRLLDGESPNEADALMLHHIPPTTWWGGV